MTVLLALALASSPQAVSQQEIEHRIRDCGMSVEPVSRRFNEVYPDATAELIRDANGQIVPQLTVFVNDQAKIRCVTDWLQTRSPTYSIAKAIPEQ